MTKKCKISIRNGRKEISHLAVRFAEPEGGNELGMAVLYLHGFGATQDGDKALYFRQKALGSGLTFCSFDFQGHGDSGGDIRELTLSRNLEDVRRVHAVLRSRGHRRIVLLGSSMGALTGLWYSALHPTELVAGIHIAPALGLEDGLAGWAGEEGLREWEDEGSLEVENEFGSWDLDWNFMLDLCSYHDHELLELYRTPCLILQGQQDDRVDWTRVQEFAAECPYRDIEFHLFADGDHRLIDRKERIWDLLWGYLGGKGYLNGTSY